MSSKVPIELLDVAEQQRGTKIPGPNVAPLAVKSPPVASQEMETKDTAAPVKQANVTLDHDESKTNGKALNVPPAATTLSKPSPSPAFTAEALQAMRVQRDQHSRVSPITRRISFGSSNLDNSPSKRGGAHRRIASDALESISPEQSQKSPKSELKIMGKTTLLQRLMPSLAPKKPTPQLETSPSNAATSSRGLTISIKGISAKGPDTQATEGETLPISRLVPAISS